MCMRITNWTKNAIKTENTEKTSTQTHKYFHHHRKKTHDRKGNHSNPKKKTENGIGRKKMHLLNHFLSSPLVPAITAATKPKLKPTPTHKQMQINKKTALIEVQFRQLQRSTW